MKVLAYEVTAAKRRFRRIGRWFEPGTMQLIRVEDLAPPQLDALVTSDKRDLVVKPVYDSPDNYVEAKGVSHAAPPAPAEHHTPPAPPAKKERGK